MYNIAIIEDCPVLRKEFSEFFQDSEKIDCVLAVDTVEKFVKFHRDFLKIDLVLLDIILYDKSGIDGIPLIRQRIPESKIIIFSVLDDEEALLQALSYGVTGFLNKNISPAELETKLVFALENNENPLSPVAARHLVNYFQPTPITSQWDLSTQEHSIMRMIADGMSYQAIADLLSMSINGVRYHVKNIYKQLKINSRQQLKRFLNQRKSQEN